MRSPAVSLPPTAKFIPVLWFFRRPQKMTSNPLLFDTCSGIVRWAAGGLQAQGQPGAGHRLRRAPGSLGRLGRHLHHHRSQRGRDGARVEHRGGAPGERRRTARRDDVAEGRRGRGGAGAIAGRTARPQRQARRRGGLRQPILHRRRSDQRLTAAGGPDRVRPR